jgi:hypothetical protein
MLLLRFCRTLPREYPVANELVLYCLAYDYTVKSTFSLHERNGLCFLTNTSAKLHDRIANTTCPNSVERRDAASLPP